MAENIPAPSAPSHFCGFLLTRPLGQKPASQSENPVIFPSGRGQPVTKWLYGLEPHPPPSPGFLNKRLVDLKVFIVI